MDNLHQQHAPADENAVRGVRQRRKQTDPIACPVCGVTVRPADMEHHYSVEIERLQKLHISDVGQRAAKAAAAVAPIRPSSTRSHHHHHHPHHLNPQHHHHHHHHHHATASAQSAPASVATGIAGSSAAGSASTSANTSGSGDSATGANGSAAGFIDPNECWSTYQRIRNNRQSRLKIKTRKRKSDDPVCPVCNEPIPDDINVHVEMCLRRNEVRPPQQNGNRGGATASTADGSAAAGCSTARHATAHNHVSVSDDGANDEDDDDDISIDVESESFEEYEWAGQTRIRAASLLQGGYAAVGVGTALQNATAGDEDEDLNVDGDDSQVYGDAQYGERDVIIPSAGTTVKERSDILYLRKLVAGDSADGGTSSSSSGSARRQDAATGADEAGNGEADERDERMADDADTFRVPTAADKAVPSGLTVDSKDQIIESLKARLREYETPQRQQNKSKCLICMDEFRIPVVSICCWHVHCEECWMRTLGARKLCPQCNMITSPTDLRRIYM